MEQSNQAHKKKQLRSWLNKCIEVYLEMVGKPVTDAIFLEMHMPTDIVKHLLKCGAIEQKSNGQYFLFNGVYVVDVFGNCKQIQIN